MSTKNVPWKELLQEADEMRFDQRVIEKKIDEGFLTRDEAEKFLKNIPEEKDFQFTSAEALDQEGTGISPTA